MMLMKENSEDGVSPVIGVMLMVVVTIIIAAVIGVMASGYVANTDATPNAVIKYLGVVQGDDFTNGYCGEIGLVFQHEQGEMIDLKEITVTLTENTRGLANETMISMYDAPTVTNELESGHAKLYPDTGKVADANKLTYRFKKIGVAVSDGGTQKNHLIYPGDMFIVFVDDIAQKEKKRYNIATVTVKRENTVYSEGSFELGPGTSYSIKDTKSGQSIASGTLSGKSYIRM